MGKRGYQPKFKKPCIKLEVFRLFDNFAFNAVLHDPRNMNGFITVPESIVHQTISIALETERLSKHKQKFAKVKRGAKARPDTILRSATKEKWINSGRGLKQLEPYLVLSESGSHIRPPPGTHSLARITPSSMGNLSRDRDKHALEVIICDFVSRRLRYWTLRLCGEL